MCVCARACACAYACACACACACVCVAPSTCRYADNLVGLRSYAASSPAFTVDGSPPAVQHVVVGATGGAAGVGGFITTTSDITVAWEGGDDDTTVEFLVGIGTEAYTDTVRGFQSAGAATTLRIQGLHLNQGEP